MTLPLPLPLLYTTLLLIILSLCTTNCNGQDPLGNLCNDQQTNNKTTIQNINHLITELVSKASSSGYFTTTSGQGQDKIYGLAQCRGDVSTDDCSGCLRDAAKEIGQRCPNQVDARIWYDYCFLRSEAVKEKNKGIGKGETKLTPLVTLYALAQCTRDLAVVDCAQCIAIAVGNFPNFCNNRKGCRAIYSNCYVRYELYPFFFPLDSSNNSSSVGNWVVQVYP
ncbi:hypothetical protein JCGZ_15125 [Jatropha curcas]|uniref:Gnk2-homologous domain-containing protein n=1 Tax=Jatropha curcas TaxID=180498 RepID=A0A067LKP9_JATCU|nr:hypothetical protein JCGZ_15125 [Jatropha curcas]